MNETIQVARIDFITGHWRLILGIIVVGLILAGSGLGVGAATGTIDSDVGEIENITPGALSITDEQARAIVLEAYPNTTVQEVDLDTEPDGTLVYDVGLDSGVEIMVNARTGTVLGPEVDDADSDGDNEND